DLATVHLCKLSNDIHQVFGTLQLLWGEHFKESSHLCVSFIVHALKLFASMISELNLHASAVFGVADTLNQVELLQLMQSIRSGWHTNIFKFRDATNSGWAVFFQATQNSELWTREVRIHRAAEIENVEFCQRGSHADC